MHVDTLSYKKHVSQQGLKMSPTLWVMILFSITPRMAPQDSTLSASDSTPVTLSQDILTIQSDGYVARRCLHLPALRCTK